MRLLGTVAALVAPRAPSHRAGSWMALVVGLHLITLWRARGSLVWSEPVALGMLLVALVAAGPVWAPVVVAAEVCMWLRLPVRLFGGSPEVGDDADHDDDYDDNFSQLGEGDHVDELADLSLDSPEDSEVDDDDSSLGHSRVLLQTPPNWGAPPPKPPAVPSQPPWRTHASAATQAAPLTPPPTVRNWDHKVRLPSPRLFPNTETRKRAWAAKPKPDTTK